MTRGKVVGVVFVLAALVVGARLLPLADWTVRLAEIIRASGAWGVALFMVVYVVSTVAMVPGSILTMLAGFVYGPIYGLPVAVPAAMLGATSSFLLGRTVLRDWVRRKVAESPRTKAIDQAIGREGFTVVLLLRLSPLVPFNALNYALSLSAISTGRFVLATLIGGIPGGWLYVYLGSLVTTAAELSTASAPQTPLRTFFYVAGLVATLVAAVVSGRIAKRALAGTLPDGDAS